MPIPWFTVELPESEGNVVIEFTIDERGEIVRTAVIQAWGLSWTRKALAGCRELAIPSRHQNGVAIASKQDYIFHFRARG